jgi:uncharacterized protein (TIGR00299 family) protein
MRTVYFDPVGGAAGDMLLAALIDLGAPLAAIRAALATLPLDGHQIETAPVAVSGVRALRVQVTVSETETHRTLADILAILGASGLSPTARERASQVFGRLAAAEARVHAVDVSAVHFHEVGAVDAIVDIAGTVVALELLGAEAVRFGILAPGTGVVETAHGPLPVPAPATLELLAGAPIRLGGPPGEWVTPTAAALLTTLGAPSLAPSLALERIGIGAGHRPRADRPNVVRALLGEMVAESKEYVAGSASIPGDAWVKSEEVIVLEAAIDDQTPEALAHATERLRAAGALDVLLTPVSMKKGRTGALLTVLAPPAAGEALARHILRETTSLGVRLRREERRVLNRAIAEVETPFGRIRMKETQRPGVDGAGPAAGGLFDAAPEAEDVASAAARHGVPFAMVADAARRAWEVGRGRAPA